MKLTARYRALPRAGRIAVIVTALITLYGLVGFLLLPYQLKPRLIEAAA